MKTTSITHWISVPTVALLAFFAFSVSGCSKEAGEGTQASLASADDALWCKEHGVEEKYCVLCHPEILTGDELLCPEHGNIPEAICTACHPELKEKYETCPHDLPTSFCPECSTEFAEFQKAHADGQTEGAEGHSHGHDHEHEHADEHEGEQS